MEKRNGCFDFFMIVLSFWGWFILTFFEIKLWIGVFIATLLAYICWKKLKTKHIIPNIRMIFSIGVICSICINLLIGITTWIAIVSAVCITLDFVYFLYMYYECR